MPGKEGEATPNNPEEKRKKPYIEEETVELPQETTGRVSDLLDDGIVIEKDDTDYSEFIQGRKVPPKKRSSLNMNPVKNDEAAEFLSAFPWKYQLALQKARTDNKQDVVKSLEMAKESFGKLEYNGILSQSTVIRSSYIIEGSNTPEVIEDLFRCMSNYLKTLGRGRD